jgi:hypothetical protein
MLWTSTAQHITTGRQANRQIVEHCWMGVTREDPLKMFLAMGWVSQRLLQRVQLHKHHTSSPAVEPLYKSTPKKALQQHDSNQRSLPILLLTNAFVLHCHKLEPHCGSSYSNVALPSQQRLATAVCASLFATHKQL